MDLEEKKKKVIDYCISFINDNGYVRLGYAIEKTIGKNPDRIDFSFYKSVSSSLVNTGKYVREINDSHNDYDIFINPNFELSELNKNVTRIQRVTLLISVGISFFTLLFAWLIHRDDLRNWKSVNLARISVTEVKYVTFRKISFKDLLDTDWGYPLHAQSEFNDPFYNPNEVLIKSIPTTYDAIQKTFNVTTSSIKIKDLKNEILQKGLRMDSVVQRFNPIITIQNVGLTSCNIDFIVESNFKIDTANYKDLIKRDPDTLLERNFTIEPGQKFSNSKYSFFVPLNATIPNIQFDYEIHFRNIYQDAIIKKFRIIGGANTFVTRNLDEFR